MATKDFKQMRVYQRAFKAALRIAEITKDLPEEKSIEFPQGIRNSSRLLCEEIAEAWFKRHRSRQRIEKTSEAISAVSFTKAFIKLAMDLDCIDASEAETLHQEYQDIGDELIKMMSDPKRWRKPALYVSEVEIDHDISL